jgi:phosphoglycolate phosphatase
LNPDRTLDGVVEPLVVGFDLDLTLVDSRPGIAATYRALSLETGVHIDADATVTRLGPPLLVEMALWFPPDRVEAAADDYRRLYPSIGVRPSPAMPGAAAAIEAVRARGGSPVVITGKYEPNARLHLDHLGLVVDALVGNAWADGKSFAMLEHGVTIYVGDHPADMTSAVRAGAHAVGVLSGDHAAADLLASGADAVLESLIDFPAFLDAYLGSGEISVGLGQPDR